MSGSRASSEVLTSPSPSPPPPQSLKGKPSTSKPKAASLDDTSSLSELTDDEGEGSRGASTHSTTPEEANGSGRRKRGSLVPAPMWGWAYKSVGRKPTDNTKAASRQGSSTPPPSPNAKLPEANGNVDAETKQTVDSKDTEHPPGSDDIDKGGESDASTEGAPDAGDQDDVEEEEEEEEEEEFEEEQADTDEEEPIARVEAPSKSDEKTGEGSPDLTDVEEADEGLSERESESDSEVESENDEDVDPVVAEEPVDEPVHKVAVDSAAPVVPAAPASSSIMAGQQLIKTPTPSPSTSPEPESRPANANPQELEPEVTTGLEPEPEADPDVDNAEDGEPVENDADVEQDVGIEAEEAETDVQPAHRAEALDVLAGIELKFALLREALYVEKMEDLAMEEAMILQGIHPEMIQLQAELQVRHDRRLELAAGKRKYEDDHVRTMRRYEEDAIWGWWKHGRDQLQSEMFAEANRKRRKLERDKRALERPPPARRVPPRPPFSTDILPLTTRELVKYTSTGLRQQDSRHRRRHAQRSARPRMYPTLSVLSLAEVQSDIQQLPIRRSLGYGPQFGNEIGPGMAIPVAPALESFPDNALGIIPGQQAFEPGHPQFAPPPTSQRPYPSPVNRSIPPQSHLQPIGAPPIGGLHHGGSRPMQGPGQPQVHIALGGPPPMPGYGNSRPTRRSPSPPPFDMNGINGPVPPHGGMSGPGQRGWSAAGPSKVNGWNKEPRRIASHDSKDVHQFDMRDMRGERELRTEKRGRDHRDEWYENGIGRDVQDHARPNGPPSHHPSGAQTHRHTLQHQSLHGIPHHHHVVHRHPGSHHHHDLSRSGASGRRHEHTGADYDHRLRRLPPDADHHANSRLNASPLWKPEDSDPRDRARPPLVGPNSAMGSLPPPPSDRLQPTPFVMTPTQASLAMQGHAPQHASRRDHWDDGRPPPFADGHAPHVQEPGPSRHGHGHVPHGHRLPSPPRQNSRNGLSSPRRIAPDTSPPFPVQSPRHHPHSLHPSPRMGTSSLKSTRPISPVPAKILPSALYPPGPTGPGTPGVGGGSSRIGTPGLAGPGTRPDGPPLPNGHGPISLFPSPVPPLTGPGGQPHLSPGNPDLLPSKMSVVPLGNGP